MNICNGFICNCQKLETGQMSLDWGMDEQIVAQSWKKILLSNRNEYYVLTYATSWWNL